MNFSQKKFGSCCRDLKGAMITPQDSFFRTEDNGLLYLMIGYVNTKQGIGYFEQAVIFCPFCGEKIQEVEFAGAPK